MRGSSPRMTTPVVSQDTTDDLTSSSGGIATRLAPPCVSADFGPRAALIRDAAKTKNRGGGEVGVIRFAISLYRLKQKGRSG